jgi:hypothetical protein
VSSTALSGLGFSSRVLGLYLISLWKVSPLISPSTTSMQSAAVAPLGEPSAQDRGMLRLCSASSSHRYSISGRAKAMVHWSLLRNFGGTADGDCGARATMVKRRGRQGSPGANSKAAARPGQHIGGIDVVELGSSNQYQHDRGALAATIPRTAMIYGREQFRAAHARPHCYSSRCGRRQGNA